MIYKNSLYSSCQSSSSGTDITKIINSWGVSTIASCILGINKIGDESGLTNLVAHSSLLLLNKKIEYDDGYEELKEKQGILIEYVDYNPNSSDYEKNFVKNNLVIYHYDNEGGLRYYGKNYNEFCKEFGNSGYIEFNIKPDFQLTFGYFLEKIAKKEDNKWIQSKYSNDITNNFNCQSFVIEVFKLLNPYFYKFNIFPNSKENEKLKSTGQKLDYFVPQNIKSILLPFYIKL